MAHIAKEDKAQINRVALIHSLQDEIDHKVKSLSEEVKENPGLRPVLDKYIDHVKTRDDEARALQHYFHLLLQSLYKIKTSPASASSQSSSRTATATLTTPYHAMKQLYLDEKAILFELHKWTEVLEGKK